MITVPKAELKKLDELIERLEELGINAEDAAARLNIALGDILAVAADRSRIAHDAHKLLRKLQQGEADARSVESKGRAAKAEPQSTASGSS